MTTLNTTIISIEDITFDRELQFRTYTDAVHIADLKSVWEQDGKFKDLPVITRVVDAESGEITYYIKDGTHRILAAKDSGATEIEVLVKDVESREEAMFEAMDVNTQHGKQLSTDDIKLMLRAIKNSTRADEFKKNPFQWNNKALKAFLKCSMRKIEEAVSDTAAEMKLDRNMQIEKLHDEGLSVRAIADELKVSRSTVQDVIKEVSENRKSAETGQLGELGEESLNSSALLPNESLEVSENRKSAETGQLDDCPFDLDDDIHELLDEDDEDDEDEVSNINDLVAGLCRKEELKVVKPTATPEVDIEGWAAIFHSMSAEEQIKALSAIGVTK
ncbi:helix-turn-helix domain-containing protein [Vibrio parahaemolyticus]|uniref:helix-turn-helix domain-containing protein n=1 Tax=Vibrio parahaemolyticus TaxID=670 RepID=UPI00301C7388